MTLEEEYQLSCYKELTTLNENKRVYLVQSVEDNHLYVKKVIDRYDLEVYEQIEKIASSDVPKIYFKVEDRGKLTLIEEYIHGDTLQDKCGKCSEIEAAKIMLKVCEILKPFHDNNPPLIHRDIKPMNIMVTNDGNVKLLDFNAARIWDNTATEDTILMGTREYAAPEQFGFGQSDVRTDIYGIGVTMNVLVTGNTVKEQTLDSELGSIVRKCTNLEPNKRYNNLAELEVVLRKFIVEENDKKSNSNNPMNLETGFEKTEKYDKSGNYAEFEKYDMTKKNDKNGKSGLKKFAPVGFRGKNPVVHALAGAGYFCIIMLSFNLMTQVRTSRNQSIATGIWFFFLALTIVAMAGNYMNIYDYLPGAKIKNIVGKIAARIALCLLALIFEFGLIIFIITAFRIPTG